MLGLLKGINKKRFVLATIAVFVFIVLTNIVIHHFIMGSIYDATATLWRPKPEMGDYRVWLFLGQLIVAKFFTLIFIKGYEGKGWIEGVRFGLWMGLFCIGGNLIAYATQPMTCEIICMWSALGTLQFMGAGVVAALVYKR